MTCFSYGAEKLLLFKCNEEPGNKTVYNTEATISVVNAPNGSLTELEGNLKVVTRYGYPPIDVVNNPFRAKLVHEDVLTGEAGALLIANRGDTFNYSAKIHAPMDFYKQNSFKIYLQATRTNSDSNEVESFLNEIMSCARK